MFFHCNLITYIELLTKSKDHKGLNESSQVVGLGNINPRDFKQRKNLEQPGGIDKK
jgi:hypothetical protein